MKTPTEATNSSGEEVPAAMNVAPATSGGNSIFSIITSKATTKKSSQSSARAKHMYEATKKWLHQAGRNMDLKRTGYGSLL